MKITFKFLLSLFIINILFFANTAESIEKVVYVIPIKGMIERGLQYVVRRGVNQAIANNASAIIFDMDTPGGRLDAAEEILKIIANANIRTYTFVNPNAISAGAIISFGTDEIWMAPGSKIGDAMPIMMSPFGTPAEMPEGIEEKAVSYVAALIRTTAERKGHDPRLAEKMVRREIEYKIGDEVISPSNQLLTLTNLEAERIVGTNDNDLRPLLSRGTVNDIDSLLKTIGLADAKLVTFEVSFAETIARYIELLSIFFLAGGLLCLYIEFKTPGFGLPGICGILLLAIWFWGHHIAGLAGLGEIIIFLTGIIMIIIEIFFIPGFGFVGVGGFILILLSLIMAMVEHYPGGTWAPPANQIQNAITQLGISLLLVGSGIYFLARFLPQTSFFKHVMLEKQLTDNEGYTAHSPDKQSLIGLKGTAVTPLRPGGIGEFEGGKRLDVLSRSDFIASGESIIIAEIQGSRIIVERVKNTNIV